MSISFLAFYQKLILFAFQGSSLGLVQVGLQALCLCTRFL